MVPRSALLLLLMGLALGAPNPASAEEPAKDLAARKAKLVLGLKTRVAIDRGARWLTEQQRGDGSFELGEGGPQGPFAQSRHRFGHTALAVNTLAHCGYAADHPVVRRGVAHLKKHWRGVTKGDHWPRASNYSLSLTVLALHTLFAKPPHVDAQDEVAPYGAARAKRKNPCGYPTWARTMITRILDWMVATRAPGGIFRYPGGLPGGPPAPRAGGAPPGARGGLEDLSNTQYVLLALWAGAQCGYTVPEEMLLQAAARLLAWQEAEGPPWQRQPDPREQGTEQRYADLGSPRMDRARGFPYVPGDVASGSMTTGGMSSLLIVKAILRLQRQLEPALTRQLDRGVWDAIAWLSQRYSIEANRPYGTTWHYYYLYGLERACVIANKTHLAERDWYREGAHLLIDAQDTSSGRWAPGKQLRGFGRRDPGVDNPFVTDLQDTCFALLFLKRATVRPQRPLLEGPTITPRGDDASATE